MRSIIGFSFLLIFASFRLFAFNRVISPSEGTWGNRQCLVIDTSDGVDCFYSLSGSNPLESGFVYDRPVLLDISGDVFLKICCVGADSQNEVYEIHFRVDEKLPKDEKERAFVQDASLRGILELNAGDELVVPDSFILGAGSSAKTPRVQAKSLKVSAENVLSRFVPFTVSSESISWRFVVALKAKKTREDDFSKNAEKVPFFFSSWEKVQFPSDGFEWRLDGGNWKKSPAKIKIDRENEHVLEWKSAENASGRFLIPKKPSIFVQRQSDGAVSFSVSEGGSWRLLSVSSGIGGEIFKRETPSSNVVFDSILGEFVSGKARFALYFDGIFMGELPAFWGIDREPPLPPALISSEEGAFSRTSVSVSAFSEENAHIRFRIMLPDGKTRVLSSESVSLPALGETIAHYKVSATAIDSYGNESLSSKYEVTIDELNYPVSSFSEIKSILKENHHVRFSVSGEIRLPSGESVIDSDCTILAANASAKIIVPADGFLSVRETWLKLDGLVIEKERGGSRSDARFIVLESANVSFSDCELSASFFRAGTAIEANESVVKISQSGVSASSSEYVCALSATSSLVLAENSRFWVSSSGAVAFSSSGGILSVRGSECVVLPQSARTGRVASLFDVSAHFFENDFRLECAENIPASAFWKDEKTLIVEDFGNIKKGFGF